MVGRNVTEPMDMNGARKPQKLFNAYLGMALLFGLISLSAIG